MMWLRGLLKKSKQKPNSNTALSAIEVSELNPAVQEPLLGHSPDAGVPEYLKDDLEGPPSPLLSVDSTKSEAEMPSLIKDESPAPEVSRASKKSFLASFFKRAKGKAIVEKGHSLPESLSKPGNLPIRVLIGYLPEVSERDAREYALGMAEKHFEQMSLASYGAFPLDNGWAFEAHEGGSGKAYLPEIIAYFKDMGATPVGEMPSVCIRTSTKMVEVQKARDGLTAVLLPSSSQASPAEWLKGTKSLIPGVSRHTEYLYVGIGLFVSGITAALLSGTVFRLQPFEEVPPPRPVQVSSGLLPRSQWVQIQSLPDNTFVQALRFRDGRWQAPELATDDLFEAPGSATEPPEAEAAPELAGETQ